MSSDDLLEVTPVNYRLRKQILDPLQRSRTRRKENG
jgi:predicted membrane GTPase involved in stress response